MRQPTHPKTNLFLSFGFGPWGAGGDFGDLGVHLEELEAEVLLRHYDRLQAGQQMLQGIIKPTQVHIRTTGTFNPI